MKMSIEVQDEAEAAAIAMIVAERRRQDDKFGKQDHDPSWWMVIMGEEFGETCQAVCEYRWAEAHPDHAGRQDRIAHAVEEASQVAAVGVAMIQSIIRDEWRDEISTALPSDKRQVAKALNWGDEHRRYDEPEPDPICGTCGVTKSHHSPGGSRYTCVFKPETQDVGVAPIGSGEHVAGIAHGGF